MASGLASGSTTAWFLAPILACIYHRNITSLFYPWKGPPVQYLQVALHPQMEKVSAILGAASLHNQHAICGAVRPQGQHMPCGEDVSGHLNTFAAGRASFIDVAACSI